jgi:hypothetical protein
MTEKRYRTYKYIYCYCFKHDQVQVGIEAYLYLNVLAGIGGILFMFLALFSPISLLSKLIAVFLLGLPAIALPLYNYFDTKKIMVEAGHADECSKKIALAYMFRASLWSQFKIMKDEDDGTRSWQ